MLLILGKQSLQNLNAEIQQEEKIKVGCGGDDPRRLKPA